MRRVLTLAALLLAATASQGMIWFGCAPKRRAATLVTEQVSDRLFVIKGGGGNTAVLITDAGLVLVDTKLAANARALLEAVKAISDRPVTTIINTHYHADHIGGNDAFGEHVEIVASERAAAQLEQLQVEERFRPTRRFGNRLTLQRGADTIDLYHFGAGHTDGDAVVVFEGLAAAHIGDLFAGKGVPVIDSKHGGSAVAFPDTLDKIVSGVAGVEQVITGHGEVSTWDDVRRHAAFNRDFLEWGRGEFERGRTTEQASVQSDLPAKYPDYHLKSYELKGNLDILYKELDPEHEPMRLWRGVRSTR
jgi:glyoxylase-like metal-dependent hydrolase (beta-lactamase superfamily II)